MRVSVLTRHSASEETVGWMIEGRGGIRIMKDPSIGPNKTESIKGHAGCAPWRKQGRVWLPRWRLSSRRVKALPNSKAPSSASAGSHAQLDLTKGIFNRLGVWFSACGRCGTCVSRSVRRSIGRLSGSAACLVGTPASNHLCGVDVRIGGRGMRSVGGTQSQLRRNAAMSPWIVTSCHVRARDGEVRDV